ncbi:MAG: hypothetical protein IIW08_10365, partial [Clostridia bacterium]|nr:hypothetical protein [Clostridia bacterium]
AVGVKEVLTGSADDALRAGGTLADNVDDIIRNAGLTQAQIDDIIKTPQGQRPNPSTYLPQEYISNDLLRVEMYKKIASIRNRDNRDDLIEELIDRFGDPTKPVMNLIDIAHLKSLAGKIGIDLIQSKGDTLQMRFSMMADIDIMKLISAMEKHKKFMLLIPGNPPSINYFEINKKNEELFKGAVEVMNEIVKDTLSV